MTLQKIIVTAPEGAEKYEQYFSVVEASKLSLEDNFLKHKPQTKAQNKFKQRVVDAIYK